MGSTGAEIAAGLAFAFFIMCPRMAGMGAVIARIHGANPYLVALAGGIVAVPLIMAMMYLVIHVGVHAAIAAAVATDLAAAGLVGTLRPRYLVETLVIALFIWVGVVAAMRIGSLVEARYT